MCIFVRLPRLDTLDLLSANGAAILACPDPVRDTRCVKVVTRVTSELGDDVFTQILLHAYRALGLVSVNGRVILLSL